MSEFSTPPGWYPDGDGWERRWDGTSWTEERRRMAEPAQPTQVRPPTPPPAGPPPRTAPRQDQPQQGFPAQPAPPVARPPQGPPAGAGYGGQAGTAPQAHHGRGG